MDLPNDTEDAVSLQPYMQLAKNTRRLENVLADNSMRVTAPKNPTKIVGRRVSFYRPSRALFRHHDTVKADRELLVHLFTS
jgi:hypothetical protein